MDHATLHEPEERGRLHMVTNIIMYIFYVKFIQCNPVYWFHQSVNVFRYLWWLQICVSGLKSGRATPETMNDWVCEKAPDIKCSFAGFTTVWDGCVANTPPLEYKKCLQCWKMITILFNAIYHFCAENIEFLITVIDVKKPLNHINGPVVIIYDEHIVKWLWYCKHSNILIVY